MNWTYDELAGMIDHSLLHPTLTDRELEDGCRIAVRYRVASVCIKPYYVRRATEMLAGTGVKVCTVVGFPHGSSTTEVKRLETRAACKDGATEIDVVANVGKALSGDWEYVTRELRAVCEEAHAHGAIVKVIIETDYLPDDLTKTRFCQALEEAGADFAKTSTGYGFTKQADGSYNYQGATEHDLKLMRRTCSSTVEIKAAGGVRTLDGLIRVRELGGTRCGASATAAMLDELRARLKLPPITSP